MNIVHIYTLYGGNKAAGKQILQSLVSKVVDSQQWRISPKKFWQGVEDLILKLLIFIQITWNLSCV